MDRYRLNLCEGSRSESKDVWSVNLRREPSSKIMPTNYLYYPQYNAALIIFDEWRNSIRIPVYSFTKNGHFLNSLGLVFGGFDKIMWKLIRFINLANY